jgi:A/G-specific adenine glycosylase
VGRTPLHKDEASQLHQALLGWYAEHQRDLPWRKTRDPYAILVAEVMLQQTQVERVIPKYREFLRCFPTPHALAEAPRAEVIRRWAPLGYNLRAVRLHEAAQQVVAQFGGRLPSGPEELRRLKGLGPYTAAAIACFAFAQDVAVVDTNVRRVLSRIANGTAPLPEREVGARAEALVPDGQASAWNQALMDLGATVCLARRPRCMLCPARAFCKAAPLLQGGNGHVAEERAGYRIKREPPFKGSSRYYRGRVVEALRQLGEGEAITLSVLGEAIKPGMAAVEMPWLLGLVHGLEADGLVKVAGKAPRIRVSLP